MGIAQPAFRVGVAGLGFGANVHVPGLRRIPGVEVCAIAGTDAGRASSAAARLGIPAGVGHYRALLEHAPAAVTLALPPAAGAEAAAYFVANGIPVLAEKPLAPDAATAGSLAAAAGSLPCAVDFEFPEIPAFALARRALASGAIGRIRHAQVTWMMQAIARPGARTGWKSDAARSGGVVPLLASHLFYLFDWLIGPVTEVCAALEVAGNPWDGHGTAADTARLLVSFAGGASASALVSNDSPGASIHRWEIVGDAGLLLIENPTRDYMAGFRAELKRPDRSETLCEPSPPAPEDGRIAPFSSLAARFVDCVRRGGVMTPGFGDGWRVQRSLDAVMASAVRRVPVAIA